MPEMLEKLRGTLGDRVSTDPERLAFVSRDASRVEPEGLPLAVVDAQSTRDVASALSWANRYRVPVAVRGAGSGLSGGAVAYADGLVVSLAAMNRIIDIDPVERLAVVEPGVVTADLDAAAREHGLFFPPDPASARISTVGGNLATNAGGLRCIAHGVAADSVAALEVVLADGRVLHTGARTRKNAVGLDLTRLFVGSEGTLGVITRATVRLKPVPPGTPQTFRASFDDLEAAGRAVTAMMASFPQPEILEMLDRPCVEAIREYRPVDLDVPGAAILIGQTVGLSARHDAEVLTAVCRAHGATDTGIAEDDALLEARRLMNPALSAQGLRVSCDVAVPVSRLADVFAGIGVIADRHGQRVAIAAHAGDGNLHPTVLVHDDPDWYPIAERVIDDITTLALSLGGTITGEHGVGAVKHHQLAMQLDDVALAVQRSLKNALDPHGILTPGRAI